MYDISLTCDLTKIEVITFFAPINDSREVNRWPFLNSKFLKNPCSTFLSILRSYISHQKRYTLVMLVLQNFRHLLNNRLEGYQRIRPRSGLNTNFKLQMNFIFLLRSQV